VIHKLLVANRGEIARRILRTAHAMGLDTVAVFSDADADAPFVREAGEAVRLPGVTPTATYLRGELLIDAARATGADAVHPGYGFLSENADFASAVVDAGLIWVGPPPEAIRAMGSKLEAKRMMQAAGVPTLPWAESVDAAADVGFPLLVKASAGGGGRGMRIVRAAGELREAVEGAAREAGSAFGDPTVFLERYVEVSRHIEVQVFADAHGTTVSLFERECSIQRRHQKIIEESPSPAIDDVMRARLGEAAVAAAKAVAYVGAGTVEFIYDDTTGEFAFLEMNTRLQVEHPVTELVTGLDLVRLQILVAQGEPLPAEAVTPVLSGHAIEVRLYAEDAEAGFLPSTGTLRAFELPADLRVDSACPTLRVDSGVETGGVVSPFYDPMLAKVIAHAPTRRDAAAHLAGALRRSRIHGVTTNRDLLVRILREDEFLAGHTDTAYLERHDPAALGRPLLDDTGELVHAIAAVLAVQVANRTAATVWRDLPSGWRNNRSQSQRVTLVRRGRSTAVHYAVDRNGLSVSVDGQRVDCVVYAATSTLVDFAVAGVRRAVRVDVNGDTVDVDSALGSSSHVVEPRFPDATAHHAHGSLTAPMPGAVVRVLVEVGGTVRAGQPLVVLEAMKMEHTVAAPGAGVVADVKVSAGQQVEAGAVLVVLDDNDEETADAD
jgi:propionyl-CoA carboxylase alpha chain